MGVLPLLLVMQWLPHSPNGHLETGPFLATSVGWALIAAAVLVWRKFRRLVLKWAALAALGFGVLLSLLSLTIDAG
jgi:hypothetical protein